MKRDRRWFWLGVAVAVVGAALAAGVPLATILTIADVLVCPAAMYFGMATMGRPPAAIQHDETAGSTGQATRGEVAARSAPAVLPEATGDGADPLVILKSRLTKGR
jgi:hypothetical protein